MIDDNKDLTEKVKDRSGRKNGFSLDDLEYWRVLRRVEHTVKRHFDREEAKEFVQKLEDLASDVFSRGRVEFSDFDQIKKLEEEIVRKGYTVRNSKLWTKVVLLSILSFIGLFFVALWSTRIFFPETIDFLFAKSWFEMSYLINLIGCLGFGSMGLGLGAMTKSFFSNRVISFETLSNLDCFNFSKGLYLIYLELILIFSLILVLTGLIDIDVLGYPVVDIVNHPPYGFFLGIICGFAETAIVARIGNVLKSLPT